MTAPDDMPNVYSLQSTWDSSILFQDQASQHAADILRYLGMLSVLDPGFSQWNQYLPVDPTPDGPLPDTLPAPYLGRPITPTSTTDELNERLAAGIQSASTDYGYPLLLGIASDDPTLDASLEMRVGASIVGIQNYAALRFNTQESAAAHATPGAIITAMIAALNLGGLHAAFLSSDFRDQQNWDLGSDQMPIGWATFIPDAAIVNSALFPVELVSSVLRTTSGNRTSNPPGAIYTLGADPLRPPLDAALAIRAALGYPDTGRPDWVPAVPPPVSSTATAVASWPFRFEPAVPSAQLITQYLTQLASHPALRSWEMVTELAGAAVTIPDDLRQPVDFATTPVDQLNEAVRRRLVVLSSNNYILHLRTAVPAQAPITLLLRTGMSTGTAANQPPLRSSLRVDFGPGDTAREVATPDLIKDVLKFAVSMLGADTASFGTDAQRQATGWKPGEWITGWATFVPDDVTVDIGTFPFSEMTSDEQISIAHPTGVGTGRLYTFGADPFTTPDGVLQAAHSSINGKRPATSA